jgi:hypothetical protein
MVCQSAHRIQEYFPSVSGEFPDQLSTSLLCSEPQIRRRRAKRTCLVIRQEPHSSRQNPGQEDNEFIGHGQPSVPDSAGTLGLMGIALAVVVTFGLTRKNVLAIRLSRRG